VKQQHNAPSHQRPFQGHHSELTCHSMTNAKKKIK
jgi:hypothetical protein